MQAFEQEINRSAFLRGSIKLFALTSLTLAGVDCTPREVPKLHGISEQEYRNINAIAEIFLIDSPVAGFDAGKAFDDYVFGHPSPLDTKDTALELAGVPSSRLASLVLDASFTPLVQLSKEDRLKRMLGWKASDNPMKRGLFNTFRQTTFFLLSSSAAFTAYTGYNSSGALTPYVR